MSETTTSAYSLANIWKHIPSTLRSLASIGTALAPQFADNPPHGPMAWASWVMAAGIAVQGALAEK
jgi:hypothetical protein